MRLCLTILFALLVLSSDAATRITASLTFTNSAGTTNGQTLTVNGSTRTFTNNVVVSSTQILTNSSATGSKTNAFTQIALNKFLQVEILDGGATNFQFVASSGVALTLTLSAGWGSVSYSTQTVASALTVRVPLSAEPTVGQRTNIASSLALGLSDYSTNAIDEDYPIAANLVGIGNAQTVTGAKIFSSFSGTAGAITNAKLLNPTSTNGVNYGNAFSSPGAVSSAEQFGSGATATTSQDTALGKNAAASGNASTALGNGAAASGQNSVAVGTGSIASGLNAIAIGKSSSATHVSSTAFGRDSTTTTSNQVRLATSSQYVSIPGNLRVEGSISNGIFADITTFPAGSDVAFGRYANTGLATGNNAGVLVGTNVFVQVSGPGGAFTINGIADGRDGKFVIILNLTTQNMTIAHDSGVDPVAANRIYSMTGADQATTGNGAAMLIYNSNVSRWILLNLAP